MGKKSLFIVDFDNTLFFTEESLKKASKDVVGKPGNYTTRMTLPASSRNKIYALSHSRYNNHNVPNTSMAQVLAREPNSYNLVMANRPASLHASVLSLIDLYGLNVHKVISGPEPQQAKESEGWKLQKIKEMGMLKKYDRIAFFDDRIENVRTMRDGLKSAKVDYYLVAKDAIFEAFNPYKRED
jgi:hypothetical protein